MVLAMIGLVVFPIREIADENTLRANTEPDLAINLALPIRSLTTNPNNKPFSGSTITPVGLRTKAERISHE